MSDQYWPRIKRDGTWEISHNSQITLVDEYLGPSQPTMAKALEWCAVKLLQRAKLTPDSHVRQLSLDEVQRAISVLARRPPDSGVHSRATTNPNVQALCNTPAADAGASG